MKVWQKSHVRVESTSRASHTAPDHARAHRAGFTLIEMMVVVGILGIIASAAIPKYEQYVFRSKRSEAIYGLRAIHDHETAYYGKTMEYSDSFEEIGRPLERGTIRADGAFEADIYVFTLDTWSLADRPNANYRATATADLDTDDSTLDILIIENQLTIKD